MDGEALYCNHQAAMWIANETAVQTWKDCDIALGIAPVPVDGQPVTFYTIFGHAIPKTSSHPQLAWEWLSFATHQSQLWLGMPARRSLLARVEITKFPQDPEMQIALRKAYQETLSVYQSADALLLGVSPWGDVLERLYA